MSDFESYYRDVNESVSSTDTYVQPEDKYDPRYNVYAAHNLSAGTMGKALDNIDDIDRLGDIIEQILNKAWGEEWGKFGADLEKGNDPTNTIMPQITYDYNYREYAKQLSSGPTLFDTIKEVVNGKETGDAFNIYRTFYDYMVEFHVWHKDSKLARKLMKKFEATYKESIGYLKQNGLAYSKFVSEIPAKDSINYDSEIPASMRCLQYFIRLEKIDVLRVSTLESIKTVVSIN